MGWICGGCLIAVGMISVPKDILNCAGNLMRDSIKNKQAFLFVYTVLVVLAALAATFIDIIPMPYKKIAFNAEENAPDGYTPCKIVFNIDQNYLLNMTFLLPYENRRQEDKLKQMMPKIKNAIIQRMDGHRADMIRNGELGKFKAELVAIINKELNTSFEDIYFDRVNLY